MTTTAHPVDVLIEEHRLIETVLGALERKTAQMSNQAFDAPFWRDAVDFIANFADGCHHYKEEDTLFPVLKECGVPEEGGPIGCMLKEHVFGRNCVRNIRENIDAAEGGSSQAVQSIAQSSNDYTSMLRQHIYKEDNILFGMAVHALSAAHVKALEGIFFDESNPRINAPTREKYHALAAKLIAAA